MNTNEGLGIGGVDQLRQVRNASLSRSSLRLCAEREEREVAVAGVGPRDKLKKVDHAS